MLASPSPASTLPARTRRIGRIAVPGLVAAALAAGTLTAVAFSSGSASAAATAGTYPIGAAPIELNQATDPEIGVIAPSADAAENGMFGTQLAWPLVPLHAAVARNGHLVSYGTPVDTAVQGGLAYDDWNLSAGAGREAHVDTTAMTDYNSFCSALVQLDDGRMLMLGGNSTTSTMFYDPASGGQAMGTRLSQERWYGSALRLTDGRVLALGGGAYYNANAYLYPNDNTGVALIPEVGDGGGAWTELTGASSTYAFGAKDNRYYYPRAFNGPNGTVIGLSGANVWSLSTDGTGALQEIGQLPYDPRVSGSQVMYAPGRILVAGGGSFSVDDQEVATNAAALLDVDGEKPAISSAAPMQYARNWLNLTVLPNGEVFADGGTKVSANPGDENAVKQSEIWNPQTGAWRTAATSQRIRSYHATSLLLPSGAVFTGGGGIPGPETNFNAELYYPSYLFAKDADGTVRWASRPAITGISGSATYGGQMTLNIGDDRAIGGASLISLPSVTHSQNTDERRIPLDVTQNGATVTANLPDSVNTMPPGDYELTVTDANGVPSAAQIITIRQGAEGLVTVASPNAPDPAAMGAMPAMPGHDMGAGAAGVAPGAAGAAPGAGEGTAGAPAVTAPTTSKATVPLAVDQSVGLEPADRKGFRVSNAGRHVQIRQVGANSARGVKDVSSWHVRPGLVSAKGVSFESVDKPGYYLASPADGKGEALLVKATTSRSIAQRATFVAVTGATGSDTTFRAWSKRSTVLGHKGLRMVVGALGSSRSSRAAATFRVLAGYSAAGHVPLTAGRSIGLEAVDQPGRRVSGDGSKVTVRKAVAGSSAVLRDRTSWVVRKVGSGLTFESVARPGYFLAAPTRGSGPTVLLKKTRSAAFTARTVFVKTKGAAEGDASFRLRSRPGLYLMKKDSRVVADPLGRTGKDRVNATFAVRSGLSAAPTR